MDDEDYESILKGKLAVDEVGFDLEYQNWDEEPIDLTDKEKESDAGFGTGWILEIDGDDWLRKYARGNNADFTAIGRSGNLGITMFGVLALINVILSTVVWFYFLD